MRFIGGLILGLLLVGGLFVYFSVSKPTPAPDATQTTAPEGSDQSALEDDGADTSEDVVVSSTSPEIAPADVAEAPAPVPQPTAGVNPAGPEANLPVAPAESPSFSAPDQLDQPTGGGQLATLPAVGSPGTASPAPLPTVPGSDDGEGSDGLSGLGDPGPAIAPSGDTLALAQPEAPAAPETAEPAPLLDGPALRVNAVAFDDVGDGPMIAVVLNDAGASPLTLETLLSLSVPLTLGIVPRSPEDIALATEAKTADYEVLAQLPVGDAAGGTGILPGMSDVDASKAAERAMRGLWMSVGASGLPTTAAGAEEEALRGVLATLKRSGYAFVDAEGPSGEIAQRTAEALDVPYVGVSQTIDAEASADEIIEMLDAVVEAAGSDGTAIVSGPASRAMLEALFRWQQQAALPARLAPVSAVIRARQGS